MSGAGWFLFTLAPCQLFVAVSIQLEALSIFANDLGIDDYVLEVRKVIPRYDLSGRRFGGSSPKKALGRNPVLGAGFGCLPWKPVGYKPWRRVGITGNFLNQVFGMTCYELFLFKPFGDSTLGLSWFDQFCRAPLGPRKLQIVRLKIFKTLFKDFRVQFNVTQELLPRVLSRFLLGSWAWRQGLGLFFSSC